MSRGSPRPLCYLSVTKTSSTFCESRKNNLELKGRQFGAGPQAVVEANQRRLSWGRKWDGSSDEESQVGMDVLMSGSELGEARCPVRLRLTQGSVGSGLVCLHIMCPPKA